MPTVREKLWVWGHAAGSHDGQYGLPGTSRMTPVEGAAYLDVPNILMVRYRDKPDPPFYQYAIPFRAMNDVVWSIVGAGGRTYADERGQVLDLALRMPNISGVIMDDFFLNEATEDRIAVLSVDELRTLRDGLVAGDRRLDLWVVLYSHNLGLPAGDHLALCDKVTFWTWKALDLADLEENFQKAEALAPDCGKVLGCYLWDYGRHQPMPLDLMEKQCETGLRWLKEGRIEGMIFLATCICDLELKAVEWTRKWIAGVADTEL